MKRLLFSISMVFVIFLAFSCATAPAAEPEPVSEPKLEPKPKLEPAPEPQVELVMLEEKNVEKPPAQDQLNTSVKGVYEVRRSNIILTGARQYTVVRNDTPSGIAKKFYGHDNGYFFPLIILASNRVIRDPDLIVPGMKLLIPDLQSNLNNAEARKEIEAFLRDMAGVYAKKTSRWAPVTQRELLKLAEFLKEL